LNILEIRGVSKTYGDHKALTDINLDIPRQSIYGLLGPNGAGKTTLIRIINQIIAPDAGDISIDGQKLAPDHIRKIGYLPEERGLYKKMKVGEQLLYFARLRGMNRSDAVARIKEWTKRMDIHEWIGNKVEDLSKGMQQKIQFIGTVLHNPDLLILDEPFSGFDPINANMIKDEILKLQEQGVSIIFSTHRMESVEELCDHIALINKSKKVMEGPKKEIKQRFRGEVYEIQHTGNFTSLNGQYEVISNEPADDNVWHTIIKMNKQESPNELIKVLLDKTEIQSFREEIPNMNEIFIRAVNELNDE
jgi:ABC-2 type transport system ATP-binding protein